MELEKYIGIDVHSSTLVVNARDAFGKVILESTVATKAEAIVQCIGGLRGRLHVTFEEGTHAQWLYDVLRRRVYEVIVCDARERAGCCKMAARGIASMQERCRIC